MLQGPGGRPMTRRDILELIGTTTIAGGRQLDGGAIGKRAGA